MIVIYNCGNRKAFLKNVKIRDKYDFFWQIIYLTTFYGTTILTQTLPDHDNRQKKSGIKRLDMIKKSISLTVKNNVISVEDIILKNNIFLFKNFNNLFSIKFI